MRQVACNATFEELGYLNGCRYVLHDRDAKFCSEFRETLAAGGVVSATPSAQSKLERVCGAPGAIGQRGVPVQADSVRGSFFEESANPIPRALS